MVKLDNAAGIATSIAGLLVGGALFRIGWEIGGKIWDAL